MKKIKLNASKLQLNKEMIVNLSSQEMGMIKGGANDTTPIVVDPGQNDPMFLSIISCHSDHGGSGCSGCASCNVCCINTVCPRT